MKRHAAVVLSTLLLLALGAAPEAFAQSLQDRVEYLRLKRAREARAAEQAARPVGPTIDQRLAQRMDFQLNNVGFQEALEVWSERTGVRMLVNWAAMENDGVGPGRADHGRTARDAGRAGVVDPADVGSTEFRFIAEVEPWGMQVRTRQQANRDVQVKIYDVRDLVMEIPHFTDAPSFELSEVLQGNAGGQGGGNAGIFGDNEDNDDDEPTAQERGDELAETIRQTVEPDIWRTNGGEFSSINFTNGRLIVRAPLYVHGQIGGSALIGRPETPTGFAFRTRNGGMRTPVVRQAAEGAPAVGAARQPLPPSTGVAGVAHNPQNVAGVAE